MKTASVPKMGAGAVDRPRISSQRFTCVEMNSKSKISWRMASKTGYRRRFGLAPSLNLPVVKVMDCLEREKRQKEADVSKDAKFTYEDFERDVEEDENCVRRARSENAEVSDNVLLAAPDFGTVPSYFWRWREDVENRKVERNSYKPSREPKLYVVYECYPVVLLPAPSIDIPVPQRPLPIELPTLQSLEEHEPPAKRRKVSSSASSESIDVS